MHDARSFLEEPAPFAALYCWSGTPSDLHEPLSPIARRAPLHPVGKKKSEKPADVCVSREMEKGDNKREKKEKFAERKREHYHSPDFIFSADLHNALAVFRAFSCETRPLPCTRDKEKAYLLSPERSCVASRRPVGLIHSVSLYNAGIYTHRHLHPPPPRCASDVVR